MVKNMSLLLVLLLAASMLAACAQPTPTPLATPVPTIDPAVTSAPTDPADSGEITVTLEDQGKTIHLKVGQTFLLKLGEDYSWDISVGNEDVIYRVRTITVIHGAQGLFSANHAGTTTLTATGDPVCREAKPACATPSIQFGVTLVVSG